MQSAQDGKIIDNMARYASKAQSERRLNGWARIRKEKGLREPTEAEREAKRQINLTYQRRKRAGLVGQTTRQKKAA